MMIFEIIEFHMVQEILTRKPWIKTTTYKSQEKVNLFRCNPRILKFTNIHIASANKIRIDETTTFC